MNREEAIKAAFAAVEAAFEAALDAAEFAAAEAYNIELDRINKEYPQ